MQFWIIRELLLKSWNCLGASDERLQAVEAALKKNVVALLAIAHALSEKTQKDCKEYRGSY